MRASLPFVFLGVAIAAGAASAASDMLAFKAERWVNSAPLTADMLRGKVVLVDFWEYTCVNWIRTSPYVKAWHRDYFSTWRGFGSGGWVRAATATSRRRSGAFWSIDQG